MTLREYTGESRTFLQAKGNPDIDDVTQYAKLDLVDAEVKDLIAMGFLRDISDECPLLAQVSKNCNRECRVFATTDLAVKMFGNYDPTKMDTVN